MWISTIKKLALGSPRGQRSRENTKSESEQNWSTLKESEERTVQDLGLIGAGGYGEVHKVIILFPQFLTQYT